MKLRRLLAYIIDILIVGFVASALANIDILNPYLDNYLESYESFNETLKNINEENVNSIIEKYTGISPKYKVREHQKEEIKR